MKLKNSIKDLQKRVRCTEFDATVAAISRLMDELSAEATGGESSPTVDLDSIFDSAEQASGRKESADLEAANGSGIPPCGNN